MNMIGTQKKAIWSWSEIWRTTKFSRGEGYTRRRTSVIITALNEIRKTKNCVCIVPVDFMMLLFLNLASCFLRYISEAVLMRITITPSIGLKILVYAFRKCTSGNYIRSVKATKKKPTLSLHLLCFPLSCCNTT